MPPLESIRCAACGEASFLKRTPQYDDAFRKTGERLACAACGHVYAREADVPFAERPKASIFTEDERPRAVKVFRDDEQGGTCRHCRHYVVNPFTQRCGRHNRVVEATDSCPDFEEPEDPGPRIGH